MCPAKRAGSQAEDSLDGEPSRSAPAVASVSSGPLERPKQDKIADLPRQMQRPGGRTEGVRNRVVAATVALLAEGGVPAVTVDAVSQRSLVARTTIYRRWGAPETLMLEALRDELAPRANPLIDTGSFRGDLKELLHNVIAFSSSQQGRGIMQAVFFQVGSAAIAEEIRGYWAARMGASAEVVRRAVRRGELDPGTPELLIVELAVAPVYMRLFLSREPVDDAYLDSVIEHVLASCGAHAPTVDARWTKDLVPEV